MITLTGKQDLATTPQQTKPESVGFSVALLITSLQREELIELAAVVMSEGGEMGFRFTNIA